VVQDAVLWCGAGSAISMLLLERYRCKDWLGRRMAIWTGSNL
jgi:hypothetical protein